MPALAGMMDERVSCHVSVSVLHRYHQLLQKWGVLFSYFSLVIFEPFVTNYENPSDCQI